MFPLLRQVLSALALAVFTTLFLRAQPTQNSETKITDRQSNTSWRDTVVAADPELKLVTFSNADPLFRKGNVPLRRMPLLPVTRSEHQISLGIFISSRVKDPLLTAEVVTPMDRYANALNETNKLHHPFNTKHNLTSNGVKIEPSISQRNRFIGDVSLKPTSFQRAVFAPALIIAAGLCTLDGDNDDNFEIQEERNRHIPNFHHRADDYLQHAPIIAVYGLNWLGVEGKNDFVNRTAILIKAELLVGVVTYSMKRITAVPRPDSKEPTSFPSGHTAQAFAAATFMAKEYGHKSIWYSIGAYTVATGVGAMRVMNNRHWISDVVVGAGVGILCTNLVYLTHQYRWGNRVKQTSIIPSFDGQTGMVNIIHRLR